MDNGDRILSWLSLFFGILTTLLGSLLWFSQETKKTILNNIVILGILLILIGASGILRGLNHIVHIIKQHHIFAADNTLVTKLFVIGLIFIGTVSYTIASYYHLKIEKWSFLKAFLIAIPFILIEYQFSLRGNYYATSILKMNAVQITLLTMTFYFINSWLLNYFILKHHVVWWRELLAFLCIIMAFLLTTSIK